MVENCIKTKEGPITILAKMYTAYGSQGALKSCKLERQSQYFQSFK